MRGSVIVGVVALLGGSLACLGGIAAVFLTRSRRETPAAFVGSAALRARVGCPSGTTPGSGDAAVIGARLAQLGIEGTTTSIDASTLELTVRGVAGPEVLRALLVPQRLAMSEVLDHPIASDVALPPGVTRRPVGMDGESYFATSPTELGTIASWAPAGSRLVIGCTMLTGATECEGAFVRTPPSLSNEHIEHAEVVTDEMSGMPQVSIEMTPAGASAFTMLTRALTRRRLAIVLDDRLMSAPVVMEEISGGRAVITLGDPGTAAAAEAEAHTLAVALDVGGALGCAYEVQSLAVIH